MRDNDEIVLSRRSAERIARVVRTVERWPVATLPVQTRPKPTAPAMAFKVTTEIQAASGQLAPGQGKGTMLDFNPTTGTFIVTGQTNIVIWSLAEIPIAVGSTVQCVSMYGQWFYDVTMCGNGISSSGS